MTDQKNPAPDVPAAGAPTSAAVAKPAREVAGASPRRPSRTAKAGSAPAGAKKPAKGAKAKSAGAAAAVAKSRAPANERRGEAAEKPKKAKLVRDSFTMPASEYELIAQLKKRCLAKGVAARKSEVLRAAVASLAASPDAAVLKAISRLTAIKTGRPAKGKP